jgi:alcohol dehydrogenase
MEARRRVWRIDRAGSLDRLALREEPLAPPGQGEVRLRVEAVGLNFADVFACQGLYSATPPGSFVPGLECAGVVEALGPGATRWRIGERVGCLTRFGAYASALNAGEDYLWGAPPGWSATEIAAYPVQALTAWYGLAQLGRAGPGSVVLLQSAAGGVGLNALALLRALDARVVAVVGSAGKRDLLVSEHGLDPAAVVLRDRRFPQALDAALQSLGATGLDVVFDAVYGRHFRAAFERLAPEGRYVLYGAADFMGGSARPNPLRLAWAWLRRPRLDPLAMISQNRGLLAFNLIWLWNEVARLPEALAATRRLIPGPPVVGGTWPFERALEAMTTLQAGHTSGKLVLRT